MFLVATESPLDADWEDRDVQIRKHAHFPTRGHSFHGGSKVVKHEWVMKDFDEALRLKWRLELVKQVKVFLREFVTGVDT